MPSRLAAALIVLATSFLVLTPAAGAQARDVPAASIPADGTALPTAPARVTLTFSREPVADLSHLAVLAGDGEEIHRFGTPVGLGRSLSQDVSIDRPGDFTIVYHAIFTDGREEQGSRRFSVGTGVPPPPAAAAAVPAVGHGHGVDPIGATLLVIDGVVTLVIVVLLMIRRPRRRRVAWRLPPDRKETS
jgi:methionine-rich copper-binding protein CopC